MDRIALLRRNCALFSQASIETDMARRIMLSIIPSLMSPVELHHTGGFDYKALRTACAGAKDVIKYGTLACAHEFLTHYAQDEMQNAEDTAYLLGKSSFEVVSPEDLDDDTWRHLQPFFAIAGGTFEGFKKFIVGISEMFKSIKDRIAQGLYRMALTEMQNHFTDKGAFGMSYGGKSWAKICEALIDLDQSYNQWQEVKNNSRGFKDPLSFEMAAMKDIIIKLNVFDGLAHNTENVMSSVLQQEQKATDKPQGYSDWHRLQRMMDAKELNKPMDVFEEVREVLNNPSDKNIFGRWIKGIDRGELIKEPASPKNDREKEIVDIRARKKIAVKLRSMEVYLNDFEKLLLGLQDETIPNRVWKASNPVDMAEMYLDGLRGDAESLVDMGENGRLTDKEIALIYGYQGTSMRSILFDWGPHLSGTSKAAHLNKIKAFRKTLNELKNIVGM